MMTLLNGSRSGAKRGRLRALVPALLAAVLLMAIAPAGASFAAEEGAPAHHGGGEANLQLPDLSQVSFLGVDGHSLLMYGLIVCALGLLFGLVIYRQLKALPVHQSMREISELIYETCKTYLIQQGRFLMILWTFISAIVLVYFGWLAVTGVDAATGAVQRGFPM